MKEFNITINGASYQVAIEELEGGSSRGVAPRQAAPAPKSVSKPVSPATPPAAKKPAAAPVSGGGTPVNAPMPGKIVKLVASAGQAVKKGDVLLILEAMKMQNEISAPSDGTVKAFHVAAGQNVKPGEVLVVIA